MGWEKPPTSTGFLGIVCHFALNDGCVNVNYVKSFQLSLQESLIVYTKVVL